MLTNIIRWWYSGSFMSLVVRAALIVVNFQFVFWMLNARSTLALAVAFLAAAIIVWQLFDLFREG